MVHPSDTHATSNPPSDILAWHAEFNLTLADLSRALTSASGIDHIAQLVLDRAQRLTTSSVGFVGYLEQESGFLVCSALTQEAWELCQVKNKELTLNSFQELHGNLAGKVKPVLLNDMESIPRELSLPPGHTPLKRFLSAPCLLGDELVGQVTLANPKQAYTERDMAAVQALADLFALAVQQNRHIEDMDAGMTGWSHNLAPKAPVPPKEPSLTHSGKIGVGVAHTDERGRYVWVSEGLCQLLGYSHQEMLSKTKSDVLPESKLMEQQRLRAGLDSPDKYAYSSKTRLLRKDGSKIDCRVTVARLKDSADSRPVSVEIFEQVLGDTEPGPKVGLAVKEKAAILDAINDSVVLQDLDYQVIWANQASTQFDDSALGEILGRRCHEIWHDSDQVCPDCHISDCLRTGQPGEQQVRLSDGRTVLVRMYPLRDGQGNVVAAVKLARDITDKANSRFDLEKNEKLLRNVLEASSDGWWNYVVRADQVYLSPNVWKLLDREVTDIGLGPEDRRPLYHPNDREEAINALADHIAGRTPRLEITLRLRTAQKEWRWFLVRGQVVERTASGEPLSAMGTLMDITERKLALDAKRESERLHMTLFETMAQGVLYRDAEGRITAVNPAALKILGLTREEAMGPHGENPNLQAIHENGSDFPPGEHPSQQALKTGRPVLDVTMAVFNPRERKYRWIKVNAVPHFKAGETRPYQVFTTFEDITRIKAQEADQIRLINELSHALKKVKKLTGLLPICASCKKIRDDQGYWQEVETYIHQHSDAQFSHSICPDCRKRLYPGLFEED